MKKLTLQDFIEKSQKIHGCKYDYSLTEYKNSKIKVKIICPEHGIFEQTPSSHLNGTSCNLCYINSKNSNTEEFIKKAIKKHGNKYDYSLVNYINSNEKVKIICPEHGVFEQSPKSHLERQNCPKCNIITTDIFIKNAIKKHGNKYDYSFSNYKNNHTKVKIICPEHGAFEQTPANHITSENNCPKCANIIRVKKSNTKEFIEKSIKIHYHKYDYSLVNYINVKTKVKIICPEHGIFEQTPFNHLCGNGCLICKESKGEKEIREYLKYNKIKYNKQKTFEDCKYIYVLRFDFYLPEYNICIEYDGVQHYKSIERFGGIKEFKKQKIKDKIKNKFCLDNNIKLIRIKYNENIIEKLTNQLIYHKI